MLNKLNFSVITIVKGRKNHLHNLLKGVRSSSVLPDEILIVAIDEKPELSEFSDLPIKIVLIKSNSENLPIGKARNVGAKNAKYDQLVFLDVDCIPEENFFDQLITEGLANRTLIMANPHYLTESLSSNYSQNELNNKSMPHPHRPEIKHLREADDYMLFWSLAFYIPKTLFELLEGFDEQFTGYGAEDTDLALKIKSRCHQFPLLLSSAKVFHQQHPVYSPPVHQLNAIVTNSRIFYKKWDRWVMENWLEEFRKLNLIEWSIEGDSIRIINDAENELVEKCYKPEAAFM